MEQADGSSAAIEMIPDGGNGDSTMTAPEGKMIKSRGKHELVPQLRFPRGYHFLPTDLELVDVYLRRRIEGKELPLDIFMDVKLLEWEPAKLIAKRKAYGEDRYFFFTVREEWQSNKDGQPRRKLRTDGVAASWKTKGGVKNIYRPGTVETVGTMRMLTYSSDRPNEDEYTMEYVLEGSKMDQWVLCTIKEKERCNANQNKEKNASGGKDKKRKRGTDTCVEPKTTKRKKTATSQPQETQEQQQQEITPATSSGPPPLLGHEQDDHHQALQAEEGVMAFEGPSPVIQVVAPHGDPVGGDQPYCHDASTPQETTPWDGPGEPPLMTHHQQGYQALMEEEQFHALDEEYMLEHQFAAMEEVQQEYPMFQYQRQQQPCNTHELLPPHGGPDPGLPSEEAYPYFDSDAGTMNDVASPVVPQATSYDPAANHQFDPIHLARNGGSSDAAMALPDQGNNQTLHMYQHGSMQFQLLQHQFQYGLRTQGFYRDITGTLQNVPQFLPESGKPPETSPDTVLEGPDPGLPSENNSHSDAGMKNGVASTMATNDGSAADNQLNPFDTLGNNFDNNPSGNGAGSDVAMGLPDQERNQALHMCPDGAQWLCGEHQGADMESCFRCATTCALYHSN